MRIKQKLPVTIIFTEDEAREVFKFHQDRKVTHKDVYLKGLRAIEKDK